MALDTLDGQRLDLGVLRRNAVSASHRSVEAHLGPPAQRSPSRPSPVNSSLVGAKNKNLIWQKINYVIWGVFH